MKRKILIVDDFKIYNEILNGMLDGDCEKIAVSNSEKAISILNSSGSDVVIFHDETQPECIESERKQLERLRNTIPGGFVSFSCRAGEKRIIYCNDKFRSMFACAEGDLNMLMPICFNMIYEEDRPELLEKANKLLEDGNKFVCVYRIKTKDGGHRWISHRALVAEHLSDGVIVNAFLIDISDQMEERERLRISEELNRLAVAHSGNIITRYDIEKKTLTLPEKYSPIYELHGVLEDIPERQIKMGAVAYDTAAGLRKMFENITKGEAFGSAKFKLNSAKGWRWLEAHYTTVFARGGEPTSAVISFNDITDMLEKEIVYNKWQQSIKERSEDSFTLFRCNLSNTAALSTCEGKLLHINFGYSKSTFDERTEEYAERNVYREDQDKYRAFLFSDSLLAEYYRKQRSKVLEYREITKTGNIRWLRLTVDLVEFPSSKDIEVYLLYEDIDEKRRADLLALECSQKDELTGALNRATFILRMEQVLQNIKPGEIHAFLMVDVDDFKNVNDTFGHGAGDHVLKCLVSNITSILRNYDLVGRLGGDEFIVFIKSIPGEEIAALKADKICQLTSQIEGFDNQISVSIGIAMAPKNGKTFEALYKKADYALYEQKKNGKNGFIFAEV